MVKDLSQQQTDKKLVQAAITALRDKGLEISAYTVANEAQIPRSTIYRSPELMELINAENGQTSNPSIMTNQASERASELEERITELEEAIWNLEKQNESLTKAQQDSYRLGFEAGVDQATKRYAGRSVAPPVDISVNSKVNIEIPSWQDSQAETIMPGQAAALLAAESLSRAADPKHRSQSETLEPSEELQHEIEAALVAESQKRASRAETMAPTEELQKQVAAALLDACVKQADEGSTPAGGFIAQPKSDGAKSSKGAPAETWSGGEGGRFPQPVLPVTPQSTADAETVAPVKSPVKESGAQPIAAGQKAQEANSGDFQPYESKIVSSFEFGTGSLATSDPDMSKFSSAAKENAAQIEQSFAQVTGDTHQAFASEPARVGFAKAPRDPDSIFNLVRSGPTMSASSSNPLVELSWKDLQTVYNFSVASLKDYSLPLAPPGAAEATEAKPKQKPKADPSLTEETLPPDPRRTGDRLQALTDPRNLFDSDAVVDLDALDIFDDLDDYIDLDKLEIINDVVTSAPQEKEGSPTAGDELRELIKGRIKQASEIPQEQAAPRTTAPPAKDGEAAAKSAGSKFVGGAKKGEPVAAPAAPIVRSLPPEVRKACMILGIKPEELNQKLVYEAWKKQIASPGVHPDLGGDTEAAVFLNIAKDTLVRFLDAQAPKLGKKFGGKTQGRPPGPEASTEK